MRFDDVLDDAQANADALGFAAQLRAAAIKPFKNALMFFRWNAFAPGLRPRDGAVREVGDG